MFSAILISANVGRGLVIRSAINETNLLTVLKLADGYPDAYELVRLLTKNEPDIVIIDCDRQDLAIDCANVVALNSANSVVIGISQSHGISTISTDRIVFDTLSYPPDSKAIADNLAKAIHAIKGGVIENLIAFIPAKAGCGSSTVALNTSAALAGPMGRKVLLLDTDLRSGVLSIMLNTVPEGWIQSALRLSADMDPLTWSACVSSVHKIDVLLSCRATMDPLPGWELFYALLRFIRPRYDLIIADLPELVNPGTSEIVRRAQQIFLVCTQEMLALKMAELRRKELLSWGVPESRLSLLVNRWDKRETGAAEIEQIVGQPIAGKFPNDYLNVRAATIGGRPVSGATGLGRSFKEFAGILCGKSKSGESKSWISDLRTMISISG